MQGSGNQAGCMVKTLPCHVRRITPAGHPCRIKCQPPKGLLDAEATGREMDTAARLRRRLNRIPLVWDRYAYFWNFHRTRGSHRGVYDSFEAAAAACAKMKQPEFAQNGHNRSGTHQVGKFDPRDYPLMVWLARAFEDSTTVFDLGGCEGRGYYAYSRFVRYPKSLRWLVCELPHNCAAGRRLAAERHAGDLEFTEDFARAEGMDILLSCGTLQCLATPFTQLMATLKQKPGHILLHRVPLGSFPTFYTLDKNDDYRYHPYRIENKQELFDAISSEGYGLVDSWKDTKRVRIPFNPGRTIDGYHGAYFRRLR